MPLNAGIWRYHPTRHEFEVFAHGTSNPWGLDFNDHGQAFVEACVIPHCFHIIQGGRYQRQAGQHFNPHTYDDIKTIADHCHYVGRQPARRQQPQSDSAGGGHAHCGTDDLPRRHLAGGISRPDLHGQHPRPAPQHGHARSRRAPATSPSHGPDFLLANDAWSRFINLRYGPDGNVYVIDWYDKQACHTGNVADLGPHQRPHLQDQLSQREAGGGVDLQKKTDAELVKYLTHENDWYVRHARRILQERNGGKADGDHIAELSLDVSKPARTNSHRLRAVWAWQSIRDRLKAEKTPLRGCDAGSESNCACLGEYSLPPNSLQRLMPCWKYLPSWQ